MEIAEILSAFHNEFSLISSKFHTYNMSITEAEYSTEDHVWKPGVYVFWHPTRGVIKVGRHLENSRKRAFQHIRDNTAEKMTALEKSSDARLLLFNVMDQKDKHWIASVEIYFEEILHPEIQSGRLG